MFRTFWRCPCRTLNSAKRTVCLACNEPRVTPTAEEKTAFTTVALPTMLAQRAVLKSHLDETVAELKRLRKEEKRLKEQLRKVKKVP